MDAEQPFALEVSRLRGLRAREVAVPETPPGRKEVEAGPLLPPAGVKGGDQLFPGGLEHPELAPGLFHHADHDAVRVHPSPSTLGGEGGCQAFQ